MTRFLRIAAQAGAVAAAAAVGAWAALLPRVLTWGATDDEVVRPLPGDTLVDNPMYVTTRAITVDAPAAAVWPWLVQLGQNRGGFYTYDVLENLMGLDIHSAERIHDEWQHLRQDVDFLTLDKDGVMTMTIRVLEPERAFVVRRGRAGGGAPRTGRLLPRRDRVQLGLLSRAPRRAHDAAHHPLARPPGPTPPRPSSRSP